MENVWKYELLGLRDNFLKNLKIALFDEKILYYLLSKKRDLVSAVLFTEKKIVSFVKNVNSSEEVNSYEYSVIKSVWKQNLSNRNCDFYIKLENVLFVFNSINNSIAESIIKKHRTMTNKDFPNNSNVKNYTFNELRKKYNDSFSKVDKNNKDTNITPSIESGNFSKIKSEMKMLISDTITGNNSTFSSTYIYNLLSKRNTLLPDGSLSMIEKIQDKLDIIEMSILDSNIKKNVNEAIELGSDISQLKNRISAIELKDYHGEIENFRAYLKNQINSFSERFEGRLSNIGDNLKLKGNELNNKFNEFNNVNKNWFKKIETNRAMLESQKEQIYTTQKAWIKTKDSFSKLESDVRILLDKNDNKNYMGKEDLNIFRSEIFSKIDFHTIFLNASFIAKNKILAIDENGKGAYFNINDFKNDIMDIIKNNELSIYKTIEDKIDNVKKISEEYIDLTTEKFNNIKELYNEINSNKNNSKKDKVDRVSLNVEEDIKKQSTTEIVSFKAIEYNFKGVKRYGIRPCTKWSIYNNNGKMGVNSLYWTVDGGPLILNNYDGIIFKNIKYYFRIPNEYIESKTYNCQFQNVRYNSKLKIDRIYEIKINSDCFSYSVIDDEGNLIDDNHKNSLLYDLKWITLFKEN